jgi:hypothetical protein
VAASALIIILLVDIWKIFRIYFFKEKKKIVTKTWHLFNCLRIFYFSDMECVQIKLIIWHKCVEAAALALSGHAIMLPYKLRVYWLHFTRSTWSYYLERKIRFKVSSADSNIFWDPSIC